MAAVFSKVSGGTIKEFEAETVAELKAVMNLEGEFTSESSVEGTVDSDHELSDNEVIIFAKQVKGGL